MKHIQLFEEFTQLPDGAVKTTFKVYHTFVGTAKEFSPQEITTLENLASLADAKHGLVGGSFDIMKGPDGACFRKDINNRYALMLGSSRENIGFDYYTAPSLEQLLPLAIDVLQPKVVWEEIK